MEAQEIYMQRALELARLGAGQVSPNPMVGCVIVHQNKIIGEGYHKKYGEDHAEIVALESVKDPDLLPEASMFVNLEPCSHHGKTPPCVDRIIDSGIKKVIICNEDPNPEVSGKGKAKLEKAGIEVETGVMENSGWFLNRRFFTYYREQRPYVILKWAQTSDGFIAKENFDSKWISNRQSRLLVHKYRSLEDAIMIGRGTAYHDDPKLTTREWLGKNPLRLVLDPNLSLSTDLNLFDGNTPTIWYNYQENEETDNWIKVKLSKTGFLNNLWNDLYHRQVLSVLIEGGGMLLKNIIEWNQWDEARVFVAPTKFGKGIEAPTIPEIHQEELAIAGDSLRVYHNSEYGRTNYH